MLRKIILLILCCFMQDVKSNQVFDDLFFPLFTVLFCKVYTNSITVRIKQIKQDLLKLSRIVSSNTKNTSESEEIVKVLSELQMKHDMTESSFIDMMLIHVFVGYSLCTVSFMLNDRRNVFCGYLMNTNNIWAQIYNFAVMGVYSVTAYDSIRLILLSQRHKREMNEFEITLNNMRTENI